MWHGNRSSKGRYGYGVTSIFGKRVYVHRLIYTRFYGLPSGEVCHKCDNPPCVRPSHLWDGTHRENIRDALSKGRMKFPDLKGEHGTAAKLTQAQAEELRSEYAVGGWNQRAIAKKYGVTQRAAWGIIHHVSYRGIVDARTRNLPSSSCSTAPTPRSR